MPDQGSAGRLRDFLLGSVVGAFAALVAARRRPSGPLPGSSPGLAAFESAPCYRETLEQGIGSRQRS